MYGVLRTLVCDRGTYVGSQRGCPGPGRPRINTQRGTDLPVVFVSYYYICVVSSHAALRPALCLSGLKGIEFLSVVDLAKAIHAKSSYHPMTRCNNANGLTHMWSKQGNQCLSYSHYIQGWKLNC